MEKGEPSWWSDAIQHFQNDDIMAECIKTYGTDGLKGRGDLFYTIVRSIIGQQISVIAAESIWNRFETMVGKVTPIMCVNSRKKRLHHVESLVQRVATSLDWPMIQKNCSTSHMQHHRTRVRKHLIRFKGVGPWTRDGDDLCLALADVYSPKDIGLVNAIKRLFLKLKPWMRLKKSQNVGLRIVQWHVGIFGERLTRFQSNTDCEYPKS